MGTSNFGRLQSMKGEETSPLLFAFFVPFVSLWFKSLFHLWLNVFSALLPLPVADPGC